jgi:hypothetical protein
MMDQRHQYEKSLLKGVGNGSGFLQHSVKTVFHHLGQGHGMKNRSADIYRSAA